MGTQNRVGRVKQGNRDDRGGVREGDRDVPYQEVVKFNECRVQSVHGNLLLLASVLDFADARWL
jgi:hypothetical protein